MSDYLSKLRSSRAASSFTESVIREMTRLAQIHDAINLGQGSPAFRPPSRPRKPRNSRSLRTTTSTRSRGACRRSERRSRPSTGATTVCGSTPKPRSA